ncbi:MAG: hypothetical protein ACR2GL_01560 [Thermoleophilaceae bacterium]
MASNPFVYSHPVAPEQLINRQAEAEQLLALAEGGHHTRLSAPRRYGKTSLLGKVRVDAEAVGMLPVYVNFYGILSADDATQRIERGYRGLRGPLSAWVTGVLRTLRPTITPPGTGLNLEPTLESDGLAALLDLPVRLFKRTGQRALVIYDEFQAVLEARPSLDGLMRSVIEQQTDEASYVFAGSHPGMMRTLFEDRERPFYGQARPVPLTPLLDEALADYVATRFADTGKQVDEALGPLLDFADGHPQRAMLIAHYLWERTPVGESADETTFSAAIEAVHDAIADQLTSLWGGFDDSERRVVAAVAANPAGPLRKETLEPLGLARTTARDALARLEHAGHVVRDGEDARFTDPLFGRWAAGGRQGLL